MGHDTEFLAKDSIRTIKTKIKAVFAAEAEHFHEKVLLGKDLKSLSKKETLESSKEILADAKQLLAKLRKI